MPEFPSRAQVVAYGAVLAVVLALGIRWIADGASEAAPAAAITVSDDAGDPATAPPGSPSAGPRAAAAPGAGVAPGAGAVTRGAGPTPGAPIGTGGGASGSTSPGATAGVTVHVAGAVRRPGLYHLPAGARVDDAIQLAGGARRRADLAAVNLAAIAEDGRQVLVPARTSRGGTAVAATPARGASTGGAAPAPAAPINLNTATLEQLDTLDGVGPATAQKILDHRTAIGGFSSVDELDQIPGIGEKRMAALREKVTV